MKIKEHLRFITAREFWKNPRENGFFNYKKNTIERVGDLFVFPLFGGSDYFLKNIKEPYFITALTVVSIALTTLFFYPKKCAEFAVKIFPLFSSIEPWMVKFGTYVISQLTILGIGLRTLGRYSNQELNTAWKQKSIVSIPVGTVITK